MKTTSRRAVMPHAPPTARFVARHVLRTCCGRARPQLRKQKAARRARPRVRRHPSCPQHKIAPRPLFRPCRQRQSATRSLAHAHSQHFEQSRHLPEGVRQAGHAHPPFSLPARSAPSAKQVAAPVAFCRGISRLLLPTLCPFFPATRTRSDGGDRQPLKYENAPDSTGHSMPTAFFTIQDGERHVLRLSFPQEHVLKASGVQKEWCA